MEIFCRELREFHEAEKKNSRSFVKFAADFLQLLPTGRLSVLGSAKNVQRIREWTGEGIIRASIGLERADDLIRDLDRALRAMGSP